MKNKSIRRSSNSKMLVVKPLKMRKPDNLQSSKNSRDLRPLLRKKQDRKQLLKRRLVRKQSLLNVRDN